MSIQIMLIAKDVKHALAMQKELEAAGVSSAINVSNTLRVASPLGNGVNGPNVAKLCKKLGCQQWRISSNMIRTFSLSGGRESMAAQFLAMIESGKVAKVGTSYVLAGNKGSVDIGESESVEAPEIDLDNVV